MRLIRFGTDGWRARVGCGFDEQSVVRIASALGVLWQAAPAGARVLVGYDTRRDSERMALVMGEVIASYGPTVLVSDRACPTPALGWSIVHDPLCAGGVMLTASEAPYDYGGVLVRQADGGPLTSERAEFVEQRIAGDPTSARGQVERIDLVSSYLEELIVRADTTSIAPRRPRVVVDSLYGTGTTLACQVFERIGCEVIPLHDKPVRDFRGIHPDPREPWVDECEREVVRTGADLGIVLNGDCSRAGFVDARGRLVSRHDITPLLLEQVLRRNDGLTRVVATLASSVRLRRKAELLGCEYTMVPSGFESLYREMGEGDVVLAVEEHGGVCFPAHLRDRDGIACALAIVGLMSYREMGVRELVDECEHQIGHMEYASRELRMDSASIQRMRNMLPGMNPGELCGMVPTRVSHADGLRVELPDGSWALLRTSRNRPLLRAYAEAPDVATRTALLQEICALAQAE